MDKFAKIFEFPKGQVLVTKEDDEDNYTVKVRTQSKSGVEGAMSYGFKTEKTRSKCFQTYDETKALNFLNNIYPLINNVPKIK